LQSRLKFASSILISGEIGLKIIKGWKKISNEGGYLNENTGQTLIISKTKFSQTYHASIYAGEATNEDNSKPVSPEFSNFSKAETYAIGLMNKHPNGIT
jgi:hypothetical protein